MRNDQPHTFSRREFLRCASAFGAASLLPVGNTALAAEPPPEVKKIRLLKLPAICLAFAYLGEELLRMEGFTEVEYVEMTANSPSVLLGAGRADMWLDTAPSVVYALANRHPVVALGGVHSGCYELFGRGHVRALRDLRGNRVSISTYGGHEHVFVSSMAAYIGVDPRRDINWVVAGTTENAIRAFSEDDADAFLGFAPQPQELRARGVGHVIVNTTTDRPWSQYFCCIVVANREFARRNPIAAKRTMRAFLKAADICAEEPERAARFMTERGHVSDYRAALEILRELPYRRWRDASPEDSLRFHALRLHDVGMISMSPKMIIEQGTDWRAFNELKRELKA